MSFFEELTKDFHMMLDVRSSLGYATATDRSTLPPFIDYCGRYYPDEKTLTKKMLDGWLSCHPYRCERTQAVFIALVRHFSKFIRSLGKEAFIPDEEYTIRSERYRPYIFNAEELSALFQAIDAPPPYVNDPGRGLVIPVLFRMMYCCGMRPSEPLRLRADDVEPINGDIYIRKSKKNKDRHIIMSEDMRRLCAEYNFLAGRREWFFQKQDGNPIPTKWMTSRFHICWNRSGLHKRGKPRPYDLRHVFASMNMMRWIDEGKDVMTLLPYLSTYMGHAKFTSTLYYIHLLPERLRKSAGIDWKRFSSIFGEVVCDEED
jgi:integrase